MFNLFSGALNLLSGGNANIIGPLMSHGTSALGGMDKYNPNAWLTSAWQNTDAGLANQIGTTWNDLSGATAQMNFNANEAQKNRDWQEHMSNTALQRQMADAKAAGLNANLLYGGGASVGGASTPSGATASAPSGHGDPISAILGVITGLNTIRKQNAEIKNVEADTQKKENESGKIQQETLYTIENTKAVRENIKNIIANTNLSEMERQKKFAEIDTLLKQQEEIGERISILKSQGKSAEIQAQFAKAEAIQRQITGYLDSMVNVANAVKGTSAMPINVHSKGVNATYHQPFQLWN